MRVKINIRDVSYFTKMRKNGIYLRYVNQETPTDEVYVTSYNNDAISYVKSCLNEIKKERNYN